MTKQKKAAAVLGLIGVTTLVGVGGGLSAQSYYAPHKSVSSNQELNDLSVALTVNIKNRDKATFVPSEVTENDLSLTFDGQTQDLLLEPIFLNKYKVSLKTIDGKKLFADDQASTIEVVLVIENILESNALIEVTKQVTGLKKPVKVVKTNKTNANSTQITKPAKPTIKLVESVDDSELADLKKVLYGLEFEVKKSSLAGKTLPSKLTNKILNEKDIFNSIKANKNFSLPLDYQVKYKIDRNQQFNDSAGSALVKVTLSKGDKSFTVVRNFTNFANLLEVTTSAVGVPIGDATNSAKVLPSKFLTSRGEIDQTKLKIVLQPQIFNPKNLDNYYISFTNVNANDNLGTLTFDVNLMLKSNFAIKKTYSNVTIENLISKSEHDKQLSEDLQKELEKISNLELNPSSDLTNKLPSEVKDSDLKSENLLPKIGDETYTKPDGSEITYSFAGDDAQNDVDGTVKVIVTISKDGVSETKEITVEGFKTKLDQVKKGDVSIELTDGNDKDSTTAGSLLNSDGSVNLDKINVVIDGNKLTPEELEGKYEIKVKPNYTNDLTGEASFDITITSKTDPTETKTFEDVKVTGLQPVTVTEELKPTDVELKEEKKPTTTVQDLITALEEAKTPEEKIEKLKEVLNVTLPAGTELKDVSVAPKPGSSTEAEITYTLSKPNVNNGTAENPSATIEVTGTPNKVTVGDFASPNELLTKELEKITDISLTPDKVAEFGGKFPYELTPDNLTEANIQATGADGQPFSPENGIKITFEEPTKPEVNNFDGTRKVIVKLEKDGETVEKELTLSGFKKLTDDDFELALTKPTEGSSTLPSSLVNEAGEVDKTKLTTSTTSTSPFSDEELAKQYEVTYEKVETNDVNGTATFNVVLTSKDDPSVTKTIPNVVVTNLQKELDKLAPTDFTLGTAGSTPKDATLASDLLLSSDKTKGDATKIQASVPADKLDPSKFAGYTPSYETNWVNDATGQASFNVTLTSNTDPSISKKFDNVVIEGLKPYEITENLETANFKLKEDKKDTTIQDLKAALDSVTDAAAKVEKLKEFFDIKLPEGTALASVEGFEAQEDSKSNANLVYTLSKDGVANGSDADKSDTTTITSPNKTVGIGGFKSEATLITNQLDKIESVTLPTTSPIKDKLPSDVKPGDLVPANLLPNDADGNKYNTPDGYNVTYEVSSDKDAVNDVDGTIKIKVTVEKDGVTDSKTVTVTGLKTKLDDLVATGLTIEPNNKATTLASEFTPTTNGSNLVLSSTSANLSTDDLEKYTITYEKQWSNDVTGEAGFKVVLTSKTDNSVTKTLENVTVTGFKPLEVEATLTNSNLKLKAEKATTTVQEIKEEIDKAVGSAAKIAKLKEYYDITTPSSDLVLSDVVSFEPVDGSATEANLTYKLSKNNVPAGSAENKDATASVESKDKVLKVSGLTDPATLATEELDKIVNLTLTSASALSTKLPSVTGTGDLTIANIDAKITGGSVYSAPEGYKLSFELVTESPTNDVDGTVKIKVSIEKDGVKKSKDLVLKGLKTKLTDLTKENLSVDVTDKATTLASEFNFSDTSKFTLASSATGMSSDDLKKYKVEITKDWANDVEGKLGYSVKLTSLTDPEQTKTFSGLETTGFKKYISSESIGTVTLKTTLAATTTVEDAKNAIAAATSSSAKIAEFNKYFDATIPAGYELKEVSALAQKADNATTGVLTYKLAKTGVDNGSPTNPSSKTGEVVQASTTVEITDFANPDNLLTAELAKINSLTFTTAQSTALGAKYAYQFGDGDFTATNIQPKENTKNYTAPTGYTLAFEKPTDQVVNNFDGTIKVNVKLTKEGKSQSKLLDLAGFKKLTKDDIAFELITPANASSTLPSTLLGSGDTLDITKAKAKIASTSSFPGDALDSQFTVSYEKVKVSDQTGKASFNVVLTSKNNGDVKKTFGPYEISDLQTEIGKLAGTNLTLSTLESKPKTNILASNLTDADLALTVEGISADDLAAKYKVTYSKKYADDATGKAGFDVTITLKEDDSVIKKFDNIEITGLKTHQVADLTEGAISLKTGKDLTLQDTIKLLDAETTTEGKIAKFKELFETNLPTNIALKAVSTLAPIEGQPTSGTLTYQLSQSNVAAGSSTETGKTTTIDSGNKTLKITGFANPGDHIDTELDKIAALVQKPDSALKSKLPSETIGGDLSTDNIGLNNASGGTYTPPAGYNLGFEMTTSTSANDVDGSIKVVVTLFKDGVKKSKELVLKEFKTKLSDLTKEKLSVNVADKATKLPSEFDFSTDKSKLSLVSSAAGMSVDDLNKYEIEITKAWANDVDGKLGFNVKLTSKTDPTQNKTFKGLETSGFKKYTSSQSITSVTLKTTLAATTTVEDAKNAIATATTAAKKLEEFNKYFDATIPAGYSLKEVESLAQKTGQPTIGVLTYKLAKTGVDNGSSTNPSSKTGEVVQASATVEITNFANPDALLTAELTKINSLTFTTAQATTLGGKYAYQFGDSDFTAANIQPKVSGKDYVTSAGYTLTFEKPTTQVVDNFNGTIKVNVKLTKEGKSQSKLLDLAGFKKFTKDDISFGLVNIANASSTLPSTLLNADNALDTTKAKAKVASSSSFPVADLDSQFTISYEKVTTSDQTGKASFKVVLTSKANPGIKSTFGPYEIAGLQKQIDKLTNGSLILSTVSSKPKANTLASTLTGADLTLAVAGISASDLAEKYNVTYTKKYSDDVTGKAGFDVTITSKEDEKVTKKFDNVEITGLKTREVADLAEGKITLKPGQDLTLQDVRKLLDAETGDANKLTKFKELFDTPLPTNIALKAVSTLAPIDGQITAGTLTYQLSESNVANGSSSQTSKTTTIHSGDKTLKITGFADPSTQMIAELAKITALAQKTGSILPSKLPSATNGGDLSVGNIDAKTVDGNIYAPPTKHSLTFEKATADPANDVDGSMKVLVTVSKEGVKKSKELVLKGFKTKLTDLTKEKLSINVTDKANTLASDFNFADKTKFALVSSATDMTVEDLKKYKVEITKNWANDVEGKIGYSVKLTSLTNPEQFKTFSDLETTGFKKYTSNQSIGAVTLKPTYTASTTVEDVKNAIAAATSSTDRVAIFNKYFSATIPPGYELEDVSSLVEKTGVATTGTLTYKLAKTGVPNGSQTNTDSTNGKVVQMPLTVEIANFANSDTLLSQELDKIQSLVFTTGQAATLGAKYAYKFGDSDFTTTNIQAKAGSANYSSPTGYTLTFEKPSSPDVNNFEGNLKVNVKLTKNGKSKSKELTLAGFKKLLPADISFGLVDGVTPSTTQPSTLLKTDGSLDTAKAKVKMGTGSAFPLTDLESQYTITYEKLVINNQTGKVKFNVILTSKAKSEITKTFGPYEISDLQTELGKLIDSNLTLSTSASKPKATTLASTLTNTDPILTIAGISASDLATKYNLTYTKKYSDDVTGKAGFDVTLTLKEDTKVVRTFNNVEITSLKAHKTPDLAAGSITLKSGKNLTFQDAKKLLDAQTNAANKLAKFNELFQSSLPANVALKAISSLEPITGDITSGTLTYQLSESNVANGTSSQTSKTTTISSTDKTIKITGFANPSDQIDVELNKIASLVQKTTSTLKSKLPSQTTGEDLNTTNIDVKNATGGTYNPPVEHNLGFEMTATSTANDVDGSIEVVVTLSKDGVKKSKELVLKGFKTKLSDLTKEKLTVNVTGKETKLPSEFNVESDKSKLSLVSSATGMSAEDLKKYKVEFTKTWANDVDGKAGFDVKLTSLTDSSQTKTFEGIETSGFKKITLPTDFSSAVITLKSNTTTVAEAKKIIDAASGADKITKFNQLFTIVLPTGTPDGTKISEISSINAVAGSTTKATLTYKLAKENVAKGTFSAKTTTATVTSASGTTTINNFADPETQVTAELAKITSLEVVVAKGLDKFAFQVTNSDLVAANYKVKNNTAIYSPSVGYNISYAIASSNLSEGNLSGEIDLTVTISKDGVTKSKTIKLEGLRKVIDADLSLALASPHKTETTLPSTLLTGSTASASVNAKMLQTTAVTTRGFLQSELNKYNVSYTKKTNNNQTGEASFDIILTLKTNDKIKQTFAGSPTLELQKELDTVKSTDISLSLARNSTILASSSTANPVASITTTYFGATQLSNYNVTFTKKWANDISGVASYDVKISLKINPDLINKTFNNIQLTGFKKETVTTSLQTSDFTLKTGKTETTVNALKSDVMSQATDFAKVTKLKEYFTIVIPAGHEITAISSIEPKPGSETTAIIGYTLAKTNVANGSVTDPNAKGSISANFSVDVVNLKDDGLTLQQEMDKITKIELTSGSALASVFPTASNAGQLTVANIQAKQGGSNYSDKEGYTLTYAMPTTLVNDNLNGTMKVMVKLVKGSRSVVKELPLSGLKSLQASDLELKTSRSVGDGSSRLPSSFVNASATINQSDFRTILITSSGFPDTEWSNYDMTYISPSDIEYYNDQKGELTLDVKLSLRTNIKQNKTFRLKITGLQKELKLINSSDLTIGVQSKTNTKPSELLNASGKPIESKLSLSIDTSKFSPTRLAGYEITYKKSWINDVDGKAGFDVTLTSIIDPNVHDTFENVEITGLKPYPVTQTLTSSNFTMKSTKQGKTPIDEIQYALSKITDKTQRVNKFKEYFDVNDIPVGHVLSNIESIDFKDGDNTTAIVKYVLSVPNIDQGSVSNKKAKGFANSPTLTVELGGFIDISSLINAQFAKITSLSMKEASTLKTKKPSQTNNEELTTTNIQPMSGSTNYTLPIDYSISYSFPSDNADRNDLAGTSKILTKLTKDGVTLSKTFILKGFGNLLSTVDPKNVSINAAKGYSDDQLLPSSFIKVGGEVDSEKLALNVLGINSVQMEKFTITYTKSWINDVDGKAGFSVKVVSKEDSSISRTFENIEMTGMKTFTFSNIFDSSNLTWKTGKANTKTVNDINNEIKILTTEAAKIAKFKEYFEVTLPENYELIDILSVKESSTAATTGIITYKIKNTKVAQGSKDNKDTYSTLKSNDLSVESIGFKYPLDLDEELDKITQIMIKPGSPLDGMESKDVKGPHLVENIIPKNKDGNVYTPKEGYRVTYGIATPDVRDEHAGTIDIKVTVYTSLSGKIEVKSKTLKLSGFTYKINELNNDQSDVQVTSKLDKIKNYASDHLKFKSNDEADINKFNITIPKWSQEAIDRYNFEIIISRINDVDADKNKRVFVFKVKMTLKSDTTITKTFGNYTFSGYKEYYEINEEISPSNWSWIPGKRGQVNEIDFRNAINGPYVQDDKDKAIYDYLQFHLPRNVKLAGISYEKDYGQNTGTIKYYLKNEHVFAGTIENPNKLSIVYNSGKTYRFQIGQFKE